MDANGVAWALPGQGQTSLDYLYDLRLPLALRSAYFPHLELCRSPTQGKAQIAPDRCDR